MARCPRCGASYSESATLAVCPACLLRLGLDVTGPDGILPTESLDNGGPPAGQPLPHRIGRYAVLELLGEGGMGVVYLAEQDEPIHRRVAVKVIKAGLSSREVLARFEAEREALTLMNHSAIAAVLDAGTTEDGRPYVVMEYVPGIPITDYSDRRRLGVRDRLALFREVCGAVQHAHHKGIVHRDLKPSNVLVAEVDGQPRIKVIDFGLAKALHGRLTNASLFTHFGVVLGTPAYMSPEQLAPSPLDVDTRTDVYSLGVLLYELLTGVLPFDPAAVRDKAIAELRHLLLELEPERPSQRLQALGSDAAELAQRRSADVGSLRRLLREDLDWIVLHALERDRSRRYQSASELVADIDRHLSDEPVSAGPPSALYRIRKLARRHRTAAAATAAIAVALIAGAIVSGALYLRAEQARRAADAHRRAAERRGYVAELGAADASLRIGSVAEARRHLERCPVDARGWEWRHLALRTDGSLIRSRTGEGRIAAVAETATGQIACVVVPPLGGEQRRASLWLFDPGREAWRRVAVDGSVLAVSPDGARAVATPWWFGGELGGRATDETATPVSRRGVLRLLDVASGEPGGTFRLPNAGRWAPPADLESVYVLGEFVMVMHNFSGEPIRTLEGHFPETVSAVISPDGTSMAAWSWDNTIQLWDLANGRVAGRLAGHEDGIIEVAVAPGGGRLASSSWDRTLRVWDLARSKTEATVVTDPVVTSVVFSPDGHWLAWGDEDGRVFVGEAANASAAESTAAHRGAVQSLAFIPDGTVLASGGMEGEVRLWRTEPLQPLGVLRGQLGPVTALAFGDAGRTVVAGSEIGELRLFRTGLTPTRAFGSGSSGDLNLLAAGSDAGGITLSARTLVERPGVMVRAWDADSGREAWHIPLEFPSSIVPFAPVTPRGGALDAAQDALDAALARGQLEEGMVGIPGSVCAALSADGRWLALAIATEVQLWEVPAATLARAIPFPRRRTAVAFRPDGGALLIAGMDGMAHVLSMEDGQRTLARDVAGVVTGVAWSPDGRRAALLLPFDRRVVILDVEAGQPSLELSYSDGPAPPILGFEEFGTPAFSPDGSLLAAPVPGHAVALWDAVTGERLATFTGHAHEATSVAFSPNGARLVSGAIDGSVLVWDAATGDLLLRLVWEDRARLEPSAVQYYLSTVLDPSSPMGPGAVARPVGPLTFGPADSEQAAVAAVGFSRDGRSVRATLLDGQVRVWNAVEESPPTRRVP